MSASETFGAPHSSQRNRFQHYSPKCQEVEFNEVWDWRFRSSLAVFANFTHMS